MSLFIAVLIRAAVGAALGFALILAIDSYSASNDGLSLLSDLRNPAPTVRESSVPVIIRLSISDAKCNDWGHANKIIDYCPYPNCPGLRENKVKRSLTGPGWVKAYPEV